MSVLDGDCVPATVTPLRQPETHTRAHTHTHNAHNPRNPRTSHLNPQVEHKLVDRRPGDSVAVWAATETAEEKLGWKSK